MQIISTHHNSAIPLALAALAKGQLVIYPTETCYGIAVDAANREAVTKLLAYKGDRHRQVSIAVTNQTMAVNYVALNPIALNLYRTFLPGPITVISKSLHKTDTRLESAEGTLGIRIPNYEFALNLITAFGRPLTATSANTSGRKEPYSLADWQRYTAQSKQELVTLFLDAGRLVERPTSTVVDTTLNDPIILRQGELTLPSSSPSFTSTSPLATKEFAKSLITRHLNLLHKYPLILALQGELGAGKTVFSKGVAAALEISTPVSSPTYTLLREYPYQLPKYEGVMYHLDTWRLSDMTELETTLHLSELMRPGNILVIEWAGKAKKYLEQFKEKYPTILINIQEKSATERLITYAFSTPDWS